MHAKIGHNYVGVMLEPMMHTINAQKGVVMWKLSKWNVMLDPIMHDKCTMHA